MQGTRDYGIHYIVDAQLGLIGFTDLHWDGDGNDIKSTLGFVFMLGSGPICWSSKKQGTFALSLVEAEYRGGVNETIQAVSMHGILIEFGIHTPPSVDIYCDN